MTLPEAFIKRTSAILGSEFQAFENSLQTDAPTSIRVNNKMVYEPSDDKVTWCENAYYLKERPLFTADPLFHGGVYYVQEASSMFLYQALKQHFAAAHTVLDLCAAPGGKSTLLSQNLPESSLLVSNEIIRSRAQILAENLIKWGNANVVVSNNEPKDFEKLPNFFDAVVIDAPCSGEGMFRKDKGAIDEWSEYNVKLCAERQREIVSSVWESLKCDGILVYSTCTYNKEENEENVEWICETLGAEILTIDLGANAQITASNFGYRFYPHKTRGEGFFLSVLKKTALTGASIKQKFDNKRTVANKNIQPFMSLLNVDRWVLHTENNLTSAYDKNRIADILLLNKTLRCMHAGILLGETKGTDFIPATSISLSKHIDKNSVVNVEVDYKTAIAYLRKDAIVLPNLQRGYVLLNYKNIPLGWVKNLGNRCNNLYPHEWRIRMKI